MQVIVEHIWFIQENRWFLMENIYGSQWNICGSQQKTCGSLRKTCGSQWIIVADPAQNHISQCLTMIDSTIVVVSRKSWEYIDIQWKSSFSQSFDVQQSNHRNGMMMMMMMMMLQGVETTNLIWVFRYELGEPWIGTIDT